MRNPNISIFISQSLVSLFFCWILSNWTIKWKIKFKKAKEIMGIAHPFDFQLSILNHCYRLSEKTKTKSNQIKYKEKKRKTHNFSQSVNHLSKSKLICLSLYIIRFENQFQCLGVACKPKNILLVEMFISSLLIICILLYTYV